MLKIIGARIKSAEIDPEKIIKMAQKLAKKNNVIIQLFDADYVYGEDHLVSAYEHAVRAFNQNRATAGSLEMEILLYAAGEYQIKNALAKLGLKKNSKSLGILFAHDTEIKDIIVKDFFSELEDDGIKFDRDDEVLVGDKQTLRQFGITETELAAVPEDRWLELILEKVALLDIQK